MNPKEIIVPFIFALTSVWLFQTYFGSKVPEEQDISGAQYQAPISGVEVHKPLNLEIDFLDTKPAGYRFVKTMLETDDVKYVFSTEGASLQEVEFKRSFGNTQRWLQTIFPPNQYEREERCFLVALDEMTPYYYQLKDQKEDEISYTLNYEAEIAQRALIKKTFTIFKKEYRVDCQIGIDILDASYSTQPRLFIVSPMLPELGKKDAITGIVNEGIDSVKVINAGAEMTQSYWSKPTLFGAQDRYFVHSLVQDSNGFAHRGYFKVTNGHHVSPIIEGPSISDSRTWNLSFYMGPKIDEDMVVVDKRLEKTINYGFFGFISKWLSHWLLELLNFLNKYVGNYGVAIIIIAILLRVLMFPFTSKTEKSLKKQQEFSKKLAYIQEKYKNDQQALNQARAELIQKHGMPGLGGCLPLLLQLPIFIALRDVLSSSIELYQAPFLWISDLSSPDQYYVFPVLTGVAMLLQSLNAEPSQRIAMVIMGGFFAVILANFSAGLALYISLSTLLGVAQTMIMKRAQ